MPSALWSSLATAEIPAGRSRECLNFSLSKQASDLMAALREHRTLPSGSVIFLANELEQLIDGLRKALGAADDLSQADVDTGRAGEVLARLRQLLETGSLGAADLARSEEALLRAVLGQERWRGFQRYVNTFSLEKAMPLLPPQQVALR